MLMKFNMKMAAKLYRRQGVGRSVVVPVVMLLFLWLSSFIAHPYYISVTELEYKPREKELQIAVKIFTDDLEDALKQASHQKINLQNKEEQKKNEALVSAYLQKHLNIQVAGKNLNYSFEGMQQEEEATWMFLLVKNVAPFTTATVNNDLLYETRSDQVNIMHFVNKGDRKSYRLTNPDKSYSFSW